MSNHAPMSTFPDEVRFNFTWRPYQARVLKELEEYLNDSRLHVVAAPGSGKTVLGIEVLRRINGPTLVLAPTLAIRDQWIQRFVELFLPKGSRKPDWISRDLDEPKFLTVATYQSLHAAMSRTPPMETDVIEQVEDVIEEDPEEHEDDELEDSDVLSWLDQSKKKMKKIDNRNALQPSFVEQLKEIGIKTLVLDEAHHLRSSWWKSLNSLIESIDGLTLLALTATPPFDVVDYEWERYVELCGPVDAEIPVPELVMQGNLCPHQDLIIFSNPSEAEKDEIKLFREEVKQFINWLKNNDTFTNHILHHKWIRNPDKYIEEILSEPDYYSSMLIYLKHNDVKVSKEAIGVVADRESHLPGFSVEWLEILLTRILYPPGIKRPQREPFLQEVHDELRRIGAVELRRIQLQNVKTIEKILKRSISKLQRIDEIARLEVESLKDNLRMVILTDYIRKETMPDDSSDMTPLNKIGVVPIFETLRRNQVNSKIGILCGSLVVIPKDSKDHLLTCTSNLSIDNSVVRLKPLDYDDAYLTVSVPENEKHKLVRAITDLFSMGGVNILVGTKSLLGEGWDAPSINSLVIASFVGSYMLSNQMRGRAIRSERGNPNKTANIWHLVCIEPDKYDGGQDFQIMERRFKAFVGVSYYEPLIENGLRRIIAEQPPFKSKQLENLNERMFDFAKNRNRMKTNWEKALRRGDEGVRLVEDIQTKKVALPRGFVFWNTIKYMFWEATWFVLYLLANTADSWGRLIALSISSGDQLILVIVSGVLLLVFTPFFLRVFWLFIKHGPIASSMKSISEALLKTLCEIGEIRTDYNKMRVVADVGEMGEVHCHLEGSKSREKAIFMTALQELLDPIQNPRYILVRKSRFFFIQRKDYHTVPTVIAAKKKYALIFANMWAKHVGKMDLIYTRNRVGRLELIKARNKSLSAAFRPKSQRITRWK